METRTNFRVRVMKYAHQLLKATGKLEILYAQGMGTLQAG